MMKNMLQRYLSILIVLFSVTIVAYGQTDRVIGKGYVKAIQFSPDGRWLAIGTTAILELYDARTYQLNRTIEMNVEALEFSPDGTEMLVADGDLLYRVDSTTGQVVETLTGGERRIDDLAYSSDGKQIASIDVRGVVRLWKKYQKAFAFQSTHPGSRKYTLLFSPDGQQLIVGADDVEIWDIATVEPVGEFFTSSPVRSLALQPNGTRLAVGTEKGQIEFWSLQTTSQTGVIDGNDVKVDGVRGHIEIDSLAFSSNGQILIVGFYDSVIGIWDMANQAWTRSWITKTRPDEEFKGWTGSTGISPNYEARSWSPLLTLSRDGKAVVAVADRSANVGRWEVATGKLTGRFEGYGYLGNLGFSANGRYLFTAGGVARVWDTATTEIIAEIQYDNGTNAAALSPNGKYVAIAHGERRITVWDMDTVTVKHVLGGALWNNSITFSPDNRLIAAVTYSFQIRVWEVETGELIAELQDRDDNSGFFSYSSVRFSPDGKWLAAASNGNWSTASQSHIVIWETQEFTLQRIVRGLGGIFSDPLEFSPDSRWIAGYAGRPEYKIKFWNIETEEVYLELLAGEVLRTGLSPDGRWFTTSIRGPDGDTYAPGVQIWDIRTQRLVAELSQPYQWIMFSPDGMTVTVAYDDGRLHFLPIETAFPYLPRNISVASKPSEPLEVVKGNALLPNYPNPFNPETWIPYQLATASLVQIHIYDSMGQRIRILDIGRQSAGAYHTRNRAAYWDGRNAVGEHVATGVYFYRLEAEDFTATKRMVIVK